MAESATKEAEQLLLEYKKTYLRVSCQQKLNCSFACWYKQFRKHTIKSHIIPVDDSFIEYLKKDGLKLPPQIEHEMDSYYELDSDNDFDDNEKDAFADNDDASAHDSNDDDDMDYSLLNGLFAMIRDKIASLKTGVVVKLNWSAPKDAKWINAETLKCEHITQMLLLLKSSPFVQHDLCCPFYGCFDYEADDEKKQQPPSIEYTLVLRKYCNLYPQREFRCFVYAHQIIAIAQRNDDDCFTDLQSETTRLRIAQCIHEFFTDCIQHKFCDAKYVMDVYVDKADKVHLIDFNPFYEYTDCGTMLSWIDVCKLIDRHTQKDTLQNIPTHDILFTYVDSTQTAKIKFHSNTQYRYPLDAVDLTDEKHINEFVESCKNEKI